MKLSINKAKEIGVIRSAKKKVFKKELVYDEFEDENMNTFATMNVKKIDAQKIKVVNDFSNYHDFDQRAEGRDGHEQSVTTK